MPWESLSHRQVLAELATEGWVPCGVGDWAVALRSPEGTLAARVCLFDPAYWAFVDLCRECAGNRWLPGIELAAGLEGGGSSSSWSSSLPWAIRSMGSSPSSGGAGSRAGFAICGPFFGSG